MSQFNIGDVIVLQIRLALKLGEYDLILEEGTVGRVRDTGIGDCKVQFHISDGISIQASVYDPFIKLDPYRVWGK